VTAELQKMEQANQPLSAEVQTAISQGGGGVSFGPAQREGPGGGVLGFSVPVLLARRHGRASDQREVRRPRPFHVPAVPAADAPERSDRGRGRARRQHAGQILGVPRSALQEPEPARSGGARGAGQAAGLNMAAFKKSLDEHKFGPAVDSDVSSANRRRFRGRRRCSSTARASPTRRASRR